MSNFQFLLRVIFNCGSPKLSHKVGFDQKQTFLKAHEIVDQTDTHKRQSINLIHHSSNVSRKQRF